MTRRSAGWTVCHLHSRGAATSASDAMTTARPTPDAKMTAAYLAGASCRWRRLSGSSRFFGIATRNGIMLVSHVRRLQTHRGVTDFRVAVRRGATERLVPILMTALAAGLALVPIAWSAGQPGGEIQGPMAMVIMFDLLSSTALNNDRGADSLRALRPSGDAR